jgi:hypothetical protein
MLEVRKRLAVSYSEGLADNSSDDGGEDDGEDEADDDHALHVRVFRCPCEHTDEGRCGENGQQDNNIPVLLRGKVEEVPVRVVRVLCHVLTLSEVFADCQLFSQFFLRRAAVASCWYLC